MGNNHSLIIGGTRGIGHSLAILLAKEGHNVSIIGKREPEESVGRIKNIKHWILDITKERLLVNALDEIIEKNGKLDNLIFLQRYRGRENDWQNEIMTSLTATKNIIERLIGKFKETNNNKSIVVVSSVASRFIVNEQPLSYHIAKASLNQMVAYYAVRLGPKGFRVNGVSPTTTLKEESREFYSRNEKLFDIYKNITPLRRMCTTEEIANVIIFLCSTKASFLTGQVIVVDGGMSLQGHESLARELLSLDNSSKRDSCRLCNTPNIKQVLRLAPTPLADSYITSNQLNEKQELYPLDIALCTDCGNVQLMDIVNPKLLYGSFIYETSNSPGLVGHFQKAAGDIIKKFNPAKEAFVVDIGSNDGSLLKFFKAKGMRVLGIDPAKDIAEKAAKSGIETLPAYFTKDLAIKIRNQKGKAYIIITNNTIANINDLDDMTEGIKELLHSKGVLVIETGYLLDLVQKFIFDNIYHEHISYFSVRPLKKFFEKHGMEVIDVQRIPTKGGSIRLFIQHKNGPRKVSQSVKESIKLEKNAKLHNPKIFFEFGKKLDGIKRELHALLNSLKKKGALIAGYGASHSVTTVIHHFDIGRMISFIVDDNKIKQGTYSPGFHIPVFSSRALYEKKPDYVIVLAWRFADDIIRRHEKYLKNNGHFIKFLPKCICIASIRSKLEVQ